MKSAPMNLKMISMENPMILNGKAISQISGNKNTRAMASGQHNTKRIHQRSKVSNVFMSNESSMQATAII